MYGSDRRGRSGRGRAAPRGRSFSGRGGHAQRRGPALPLTLLRELGGDGSASGGAAGGSGRGYRGRGGSAGRGRERDAGGRGAAHSGFKRRAADERTEPPSGGERARLDKDAVEQRPAKRRLVTPRDADGGSGGGGRADPRVSGGLTRTLAAMKQRQQAGSGPGFGSGPRSGSGSGPAGSKTKFHELLVDGWESRNGREAFLEELRMQARLAKRLGKSKKDALDGMDKLMGFLSAGSGSMLPKFLDPDGRREAEDLLTKSGSGSGSGGAGSAGRGSRAAGQARGSAAAAPPTDAAAAARRAAELLDQESDEELEFFGIDPANRDADLDDEEDEAGRGVYGFGSEDSGSEGEEAEEDEEGGGGGGTESGSEEGDGGDESSEEEEEDEDEEEGGYDMLGQLMGSDSDAEEGAEESDTPEDGEEGEGEDGSDEGEQGDGSGDDAEEEEEEEMEAARARRGGGAAAEVMAAGAGAKYVPPALRAQMAAAAAAGGSGGGHSGLDAARAQVERRVTGLINRLAEANLQPISREVAELYGSQGRRLVSEAVAAQILGAAETGPRASEQFAAVAAAFVAAVAALAEAQDLAAGFLARLSERLEAARNSGDGLAQANLVTLLAYVYSAGLVGPGLCYSLLGALKERFQEADVAAMVTLLNAVGLQLRNSDPRLMKEFVLGVHERASQLGRDGQISRRAQLMLDLIIDIKNNKTSAAGAAAADVSLGGTATRKSKGAAAAAAAGGAGGAGRRGGALAVLQPSVAKWLQQIGVEEVCLRGLTWQKLLAPNKKGMWWMPVAGEALDDPLMLAAAGGGGGGATVTAGAAATVNTAKLLQLAAEQRMSTDARRAVFVAIMGSEDCAEAHEKLLRLPLKGDQRREIVRVLVDCCLGEKAWNPFYAFLALRLCGGGGGEGGGGGGGSVGRAHRVTMQYCLWDKLKEVESMDVRQLTHLAKLAALLVARFAMSLSWLKVVDWSDLSAKQMLTWRIFLQHLLSSCKTAGDVKEIFARVAAQPKTLSPLISGLLLFLRASFAPWAATKLPPGPESDELLRRTRTAEKELAAGASAAAAVLI